MVAWVTGGASWAGQAAPDAPYDGRRGPLDPTGRPAVFRLRPNG